LSVATVSPALHELNYVYVGTAGAGSLILEFGTLSRLTGDERFEKAARRAFFALWDNRTDVGLVGNTIDVESGVCVLSPAHPSDSSPGCDSSGCIPQSPELVQELTPSTSMH